jgi:predicted nucleic acid-binding protein
MNELTVVLDSCVLYPAPLRDFLMHLALLDLFQAKWTEIIHTEWIRNVLKSRPDLNLSQLERTKKLMNLHIRDCPVENYESLIETLTLPDKEDRHVLAAAIHAKADVILTFNLKDFPAKNLADYGIEAIHPDKFIVSLIDADAEKVCLAAERQRLSLKNPPKNRDEFLQILRQQNLTESCEKLEKLL